MAFNASNSFSSNDSGYDSGIIEIFDEPAPVSRSVQVRDKVNHYQQTLAAELSRQVEEEYQHDILDHMLHVEAETVPDVDSIDIQTEIQWFMRPYLLDFLIEAHSAFQLLPETLFLTINLLDRYCSRRVVYKRHYQLVGCAALLIAAKYGDKKEKVPTIKELKSMCCSLYDDDMFLQMEWHVLSTLSWSVGHPTVDSFVKLATKDGVPDPETENLALYILEIAMYHRDFVSKRSSILALAALALARRILGRPQARPIEWASQFCTTTYLELAQKLDNSSLVLARKYSSARQMNVSRILSSFLAQQAALAAPVHAPLTPVYELTPPTSMASKAPVNGYFACTTPTKPQGPFAMQHDYPTPPITPEDEMHIEEKLHNLGHGGQQPLAPPTPTPQNTVGTQYHPYDIQARYQPPPSSHWTFQPY